VTIFGKLQAEAFTAQAGGDLIRKVKAGFDDDEA